MRSLYLTISIITLIIANEGTGLAQSETKGYIITIEHDTITGFIIDETDADMGLKIKFKKELSDNAITEYSATELLGFRFQNGRTFDQLPIAEKPNDTIKVFAKKILEGKIDLHIWKRHKADDYIFLKNNATHRSVFLTKPTQEIMSGENGINYIMAGKKYIGLLAYVKADSSNTPLKITAFKYSEKKIIKNIISYNNSFQKNFPTKQYKEQKKYTNDLIVGMPVVLNYKEGLSFRIAYYRNITYPENSRKLSFFGGISYRYWSDRKNFDNTIENDNVNYKNNWLSIIPAGINFHSASGTIRPYGYIGIGLFLLIQTDHNYVNYKNVGDTNEFYGFLAVNLGIGVKIKLGNNYLLCELTPSIDYNGIFLNIGFSF